MSFLKGVINAIPAVRLAKEFSGASQQKDANEKAMQAWNLMNDYNSPASQVERLVAAGLNPYLVNISGNTTGSPGLVGGTVDTLPQSAFKGLSQIIGASQGFANLQNTRAQTNLAGAQAGVAGANAALLGAREQGQVIQNELMHDTMIADLDYKREQTKLVQAQRDKTAAEATIAQGEADILAPVGGSKGASTIFGGFKEAFKSGLRTYRALKK